MVDTQAIDPALRYQAQGQGMHDREYIVAIHGQGSQPIDVEETAVVDDIAAAAPPRQPIVLQVEHTSQCSRREALFMQKPLARWRKRKARWAIGKLPFPLLIGRHRQAALGEQRIERL